MKSSMCDSSNLHTEINVWHRELKPDTTTHASTNWARRKLTLLVETNVLPLCQTTKEHMV